MDSSIYIDGINFEWFIIHLKESQVGISSHIVFLSQKIRSWKKVQTRVNCCIVKHTISVFTVKMFSNLHVNNQLHIHIYHVPKFENNPPSGYRDLGRTKFGKERKGKKKYGWSRNMRKSAMISTILMRITLFSYTIKEKLCPFEKGSLNVFKINDVILNDVLATSYRATQCTSMKSPCELVCWNTFERSATSLNLHASQNTLDQFK